MFLEGIYKGWADCSHHLIFVNKLMAHSHSPVAELNTFDSDCGPQSRKCLLSGSLQMLPTFGIGFLSAIR